MSAKRVSAPEYRVIGRRDAAILFVTALFLSLLLSGALYELMNPILSEIERLIDTNPQRARSEAARVFRYFLAGTTALVVALAAYIGWTSYRTLVTVHSPPLGARVVEGQRVRTGGDARRVGWALAMAAITLLAAGGVALIFGFRLLESLGRGGG